MRVLVSGAHGFLGSHVTRALLQAGHEVRALVSPWGDLRNLEAMPAAGRLGVVQADLTDPDTVFFSCDGVDAVVHAAARVTDWGNREELDRVNVGGTRTLLDEAVRAGVGRFVLVSSVAVHRYVGFRDADPRLVPRDNFGNAYARSKILAEDLVMAERRLEPVVVRPGLWPFGQADATFARVARAVRARALPLVGGGSAVLNTAYAPNFADGVVLAATRPEAAGRAYVLADDGMPSWRDVFGELASALGVRPPRLTLPAAPVRVAARLVERAWASLAPRSEPPLTNYRAALMVHDVHFSTAHARRELGHAPRHSWQQGIVEAVRASALGAGGP